MASRSTHVEQRQDPPLVEQYQRAFDELRSEGTDAPRVKRVSELLSLLELTTTLGSGRAREETLNAALVIVMREVEASRGALFLRTDDDSMVLRAALGLPPDAPRTLGHAAPFDEITALGRGDDAHDRHGLVLLCPIRRRERPMAVLGLGPRDEGRAYGAEEHAFLRCVVACGATAIENGVIYDELRLVSQRRTFDVVQLHNLLDVSRELTGSIDEKAVHDLVATSLMGHFVVSRCAIYLLGPRGLALAHGRGLLRERESAVIPSEQALATLEGLLEPRAVAELPDGALRRRLEKARLVLAVPLATRERLEGVLAIGERASGMPFTDEDRGFAQALARLAVAALENARLQRVREEKQRQDRELQIAREIQRSLFPPRAPEVPGFEVAAVSRPCYEVGGDSYDWIPLGGERLALVVADVSGKGTPASLLMASVHASVRALAGTGPPARVIERLNRFLFASTQPGRYVTLFYAELDASSRRLSYVNAGHVPPYRLSPGGMLSRLVEGGPALGLLDEAAYEVGEATLLPGDVVAMVTDGVTEASSPDEREFGDDRVCEVVRTLSGLDASSVVNGLVAAVDEWKDVARLSDDLTALVLRAR